MNNEQWDAEVRYCIRLIENRGNISVPLESVGNYLDTQARQADRDHASKLVKAFDEAARLWRAKQSDAAADVLRLVWLTA